MIFFVHHSRTRNIGDLFCSPFRYFDWADHKVRDIRDDQPERADAVIYGGGVIGPVSLRRSMKQAPKKIAWGVGTSNHGTTEPKPWSSRHKAEAGIDLYGARDMRHVDQGAIYAPCVSCLNSGIDAFMRHGAVRRIGVYNNVNPRIRAKASVMVDGLASEHYAGNELQLLDALQFLAESEVIVTNSYHGAYWGTLLGRRVFIAGAYSSKLSGFKHQPPVTKQRTVSPSMAMDKAKAFPEALAETRAATMEFFGKVQKLLGKEAVTCSR